MSEPNHRLQMIKRLASENCQMVNAFFRIEFEIFDQFSTLYKLKIAPEKVTPPQKKIGGQELFTIIKH